MSERKMATIRKIDEIRPIEGADAIEAYRVGGWWVVDKKNAHKVNDLVVYVEIDAFIPHAIAPFLSKGKEPREYNGVKGERLRTVKLRGQVSQGLLLPIETAFPGSDRRFWWSQVNVDISERLGIQKWEAPIPASLSGDVEGVFPTVVPKTDQERIQNLTEELKTWQSNSAFTWEVTEKLDGSSMTVFVHGDREGVCSRNRSLKETAGNTLWAVARREQLIEKVRQTGRNLALQGELVGEGIQGNAYNVKGQDFRLFDIYDIDRGEYLGPVERRVFAETHGIKHVPVITTEMVIEEWVTGLLTIADGVSTLNPKTNREGLVFKCNTFGGPSFKAISNKWLILHSN
jgi:RNA ligase (TIGR02306 family)